MSSNLCLFPHRFSVWPPKCVYQWLTSHLQLIWTPSGEMEGWLVEQKVLYTEITPTSHLNTMWYCVDWWNRRFCLPKSHLHLIWRPCGGTQGWLVQQKVLSIEITPTSHLSTTWYCVHWWNRRFCLPKSHLHLIWPPRGTVFTGGTEGSVYRNRIYSSCCQHPP